MSLNVKVSGTWRNGVPKAKVSGTWRNVKQAYVKVSGTWREILSKGWDLTPYKVSATYDGVGFSVNSQDTSPQGIFFKPDGTKMYMVGSNNDAVYQYTLSTAWIVSTATYDSVSFGIVSEDGNSSGLFFKSDGTKMYIVGTSNNTIHQYSLSTAWDLSTASYDSVSFDVSTENESPTDISFKSDGTKMYVLGAGGIDSIYQYTLSTPWDLSTASYDSVNFDVSSEDTAPQSIFFKPDGTKMYMAGVIGGDFIYQYTLSTPWDLSTASYDGVSFNVNEEATPLGLFFKSDGTKMYIVGLSSDTVFQYTLSTAWNIGNTINIYDSVNFDVSSEDTAPQSIFFKPDGTKMYMLGANNDAVYQYTASTPWDLSTASYDVTNLSVFSQDTSPQGIFFKPDGTKMYMLGTDNDSIYQYTLSTAWSIGTASYDSVSFDVSSQALSPQGIFFKSDGTKMYVTGVTTDSIYQYTLSTPWDLSTASYDGVSFNVNSEDEIPSGLFFKSDGTKMYMLGNFNDAVYQYSLSTPWDLSTASYDNVRYYVGNEELSVHGIFFKYDGTRFYITGPITDKVYQYTL